MGNTIWGVGVGVGVGVGDNPPLPLLPEEVLIEILLWLPVISLLRFKSVCKSWRDLIHSPFFIHLHTTNTFSPSSSNSKQIGVGGGGDAFILQPSFGSLYKGGSCGEMDRDMFMLSFESGGSSGGDDDQDQVVVFKLDNLGFPPYYNKVLPIYSSSYRIHMVGSCNGLICLHDVNRREVSLWNPATRQFRILPKSITIPEEEEEEDEDEDGICTYSYDVVALGFDVKTKDYKVVQISWVGLNYISQWRPEYICRVQVYSLSTDSWRLLEGITCLPAKPIHTLSRNHLGLYLNGSYFFLGRKRPSKPLSIEEMNELGTPRNDSLMISFDFTKEIFTTMQFPDHDDRYDLLITHLGDKIALFTTRMESSSSSSFGPGGDEYYDIWVLNEQGGEVNKESWAKLHSYQIKDRGARWIRPRGILNDGEFALIETEIYFPDNDFNEVHLNGLQLLNLVTKEPKKSFRIYDKVLKAAVYKHSLVSITGEKGAAAAANRVVGDVMCPIVT